MNQQAKTKREFPYVSLILIVTLVLVVAILGYTFVESIGVIGRLDNAAKSNNIKLNEKELDVYRYHVGQNQLYTEFLYYQYGLMTDSYGITKAFENGYKYANYMLPNYVGTGSFDSSAYAYAEQYLTYCEAVMAEGKYEQYKADVADDIEEYIEGLKETAKANRVSLSKYLNMWVGKGVSQADVKSAMEYYFIAGKYAEELHDKFSDALNLEDIEKYVSEHKSDFYSAKYTSYKLVSSDNADFLAAIKAAKTADEVKIAIVDYYMNQKFEAQYKSKITDKNIEDAAGVEQTKADVRTTLLVLNKLAGKDADGNEIKAVFTDQDTDAYKKAAYEIATTINTTVATEIAKVTESSAKWADPAGTSATDLQKWLFGDGRKVGDFTVLETKTTSKDSAGKETTTTTYTWYVVDKALDRDNELTKNAYYILLSNDAENAENRKTAAEKAEAFFSELNAAKTPEKFAELVEKYAPGYSADLVEQISFESMKGSNEDLANWLYEDGRAKGDITKIAVKGDSKDTEKVTGYIIALFDGENEETWKLNGRTAIADEQLEAWYEDAVKKYNVVVDYEFETTAASTTAATTTAATTKPATTEPTTDAATEATTEAGTEEATEAATEETTEAPTEAQ